MNRRTGYTLIELLIAMGSASVLMVGMSSALYVSSRALDIDSGVNEQRNESNESLAMLLSELEEARRFSTLTPTVAEFTVPDRTGDAAEETLRYAWSGVAGDPLTRSFNGGTAVPLVRDVSSLSFTALTRSVNADPVNASAASLAPVIEGWNFETANGRQIDVPIPAGSVSGELLLAAVVADGNVAASMTPPAGWTEVTPVGDGLIRVTLGVWWKLYSPSDPATYRWEWSRSERAVGWMLRISNQGTASPVAAAAEGSTDAPECPPITVSSDNTLVVRIGAFDRNRINVGNPGMTGQIPLLMVESDSGAGSVSGGCAYATQASAGTAPPARFSLTGADESRTVTVVIPSED